MKRRLYLFSELVRQQLLARHSVRSRQGPIQRLLLAGEEHFRVTPRFHPKHLETPHSLLAVRQSASAAGLGGRLFDVSCHLQIRVPFTLRSSAKLNRTDDPQLVGDGESTPSSAN
ncbi:hypothetical protein T265_11852 [Opisthorchis viverrini]|uniref:Uncharacterized protein n=1 Tax=Opisthorchis viverrini TaxID=6198 RepID=A0A074Z1H9_OPIVI|nr:hypothetical protein T265_11852 [Opisthorchis viverrini]KER19342.1 hypothetical protein T265_11852 [Opisthorchis viverrini]